uniref:ABC transporter ATP-binding protein n=1 Tax=Algoriphagus sp. TaxID=1872435 RepID=UPI004047EE9E
MKLIYTLYNLLDKNQKKRIALLQVLVVFSAVFESFSIIAISPLISIVSDPNNANDNQIFNIFKKTFSIIEVNDFIFYYSIFFLIVLFFSNLLSIITIWLLSVFAAKFGGKLSDRLYSLYSSMNYSKFILLGSSYITKQIATEVSRLTDNVLQPIVQINARVISGIFISVLLFFYNPFATLLSVIIFSIAYFLIFLFVKNKLSFNGRSLSKINEARFGYITEAFMAFREIKSFGTSEIFNKRFSNSSTVYSKIYSTLNTIYNIPKYIIEFFVFSTLVILILKYNSIDGSKELLSIISVFGLGAFKLLPIFQQLYNSSAQIKSHSNALDFIYKDINDESYTSDISDRLYLDKFPLSFPGNNFGDKVLEVQNISFYYLEGNPILEEISIDFFQGTRTAILGKSGAGKSTLLDIITGLLVPSRGKILYNGFAIDINSLSYLRYNISLVSQSPFIFKGSFAQNVSFSLDEFIDYSKVESICRQVGLMQTIDSFAGGLNSIIGDGHILLSGGQKQRLAIARALYRDCQIIFFDEPTSSLDPKSKEEITKLINSLIPLKTVITITHDLSTIIDYEKIILIHDGHVRHAGTLSELKENSELYSKII